MLQDGLSRSKRLSGLCFWAQARSYYTRRRGGGGTRFSGEECWHTIMDCCKRRGTASAPTSLRLLPAPEAQRWAPRVQEEKPRRTSHGQEAPLPWGGLAPRREAPPDAGRLSAGASWLPAAWQARPKAKVGTLLRIGKTNDIFAPAPR